MHVELPSGATAELRDPDGLTEAGRRTFKIWTAASRDPHSTQMERATAAAEADDWMVAMFVKEWSLDEPIPQAKIETLRELPHDDYDALVTAVLPLTQRAFPNFGPTLDESAPFLASRAPEVGAERRADRRDEAAAGSVEDVPAGEADRLVTG